MNPELVSLIAGSATGFIFRHMAEKRQNDQDNFKRLIEANTKTNANADAAVKRVPIDAGKAVRRVIVLMILFGTIVAPFVLPFFGIPTIVEVRTTHPEWMFGLVPERSEIIFQEVRGYLFTQENREILVSVVGFYFGSAAAANKT
jgi:hypothetical protein